jgi:hypothetical protein
MRPGAASTGTTIGGASCATRTSTTGWSISGPALPAIRAAAGHHLDTRGLGRDRVLAAAIRLIDLGFFRPGGEEYAEQNGTFGLATITKDHVTLTKGQLVFEYLAKGAKQREQAVAEEQVCAAVRSLRRRRGGGDQLLAYRVGSGWRDVTAADISDYLREISGGDYTAKDFRAWHATVLAAVGLAVSESAGSDTARQRAIVRVVQEVAAYLGNTPAVARASYIDPRVLSRYQEGRTIAAALGELGQGCDFGDLATMGQGRTGRPGPAGLGLALAVVAALGQFPPAGLGDLEVVAPGRGQDPLPRLVPLGVADPLDLAEPGDRVAHVAGVGQRLLTFVRERELLAGQLVLVRGAHALAAARNILAVRPGALRVPGLADVPAGGFLLLLGGH